MDLFKISVVSQLTFLKMKEKLLFVFGILFFMLVLSACKGPIQNKDSNCPEISNVDVLLNKQSPQIIVFGELHGTVESPQFIGDVICELLHHKIPVTLALEYSDEHMVDVNRFIASDSISDQSDLLKTSYWYGGNQDGKRSKAMFSLIKRLKNFRQQDERFSVIGFDVGSRFLQDLKGQPRGEIESQRERVMAEDLKNYSNENPGRKIIVLTGNLHSKRNSGDRQFNNMVDYLPRSNYLSLEMSAQAGTMWTWMGGETHVKSNVVPSSIENEIPSNKRAIVLNNAIDETDHDGIYYTVTKTASPPAGRGE